MSNYVEDEAAYQRWLHEDDEYVDPEEVLDGEELADYYRKRRMGLAGPAPRKDWR